MNGTTLERIKNHFKAVFDLIQLMELEEYGNCCSTKICISKCGKCRTCIYEMDCKRYFVKYIDGKCVQLTDITIIKR